MLGRIFEGRRRVACLVLLLGLVAPVAAADWSDGCRQTVLDYAYYRDRPDADGVANLFTDDAVFVLGADSFMGREAIHARIVKGQGGPVFRHMMSTIKILPIDGDRASGVSYAAVYSGAAGELPVVSGDFLALGEYHDEFARVDSGCKIARREFVRVMVPAP